MRAAAMLLAVALCAASVSGCASQRREMMEARAAYQRCVDEGPGAERRCAELKAEADVKAERYEEDAIRNWGCTLHNSDRCDPGMVEPRH